MSVEELLGYARWSVVYFSLKSHCLEARSEGLAEHLWSISLDGQAAARFGSVEAERRDDDMASDWDGVIETVHI